jgi:hypothetical protein
MVLLSDIERDRLLHRSKDSKTRASNDVRVRKKLRAWLENAYDIALVCEYLPEDQVTREIVDNHVFLLMGIARQLIEILRFYPIGGKVDHPEDWKVLLPSGATRPVEDRDLERSLSLKKVLTDLVPFHGRDNPMDAILRISELDADPVLRERITDGERVALNRVTDALINYNT